MQAISHNTVGTNNTRFKAQGGRALVQIHFEYRVSIFEDTPAHKNILSKFSVHANSFASHRTELGRLVGLALSGL